LLVAPSACLHPRAMHTFAAMAKALNRSPVYLKGLQARFELPAPGGTAYSDAYVAFLRSIIHLRILGVTEAALLHLWRLERKLLTLLNVDSTGSATWFLDACGQTSHRNRRLLLSNYDLGVAIPSGTLQLGLNFREAMPELFAGKEMGEDALRVLEKYLKTLATIRRDLTNELPQVHAAVKRSRRLLGATTCTDRSNRAKRNLPLRDDRLSPS
jgi:hypothetical protein